MFVYFEATRRSLKLWPAHLRGHQFETRDPKALQDRFAASQKITREERRIPDNVVHFIEAHEDLR